MIDDLARQIEQAVEQIYDVKTKANVTVAPEETGADYASNVAMQLTKILHRSPKEIAEKIANVLSSKMVDWKVEIAGPGFLNFISPDEYFSEKIADFAENWANFGKNISPDEYYKKTVVVEFSDPNPFKVLHVGHLYTSVVGDALSRMLEFAGAKVVRANFGGDVGLHVAKTCWKLLDDLAVEAKSSSGSEISQGNNNDKGADDSQRFSVDENAVQAMLKDLTIEKIAKAYVDGTRAYDEDVQAKAEITALNKEIYKINAEKIKDGALAELYWRGRELSYQYFDDFYAKIGVKFDKYYPESSVTERGMKEVREHTGNVYERSEGAVVFRGEKFGLHTRVFINREGVPTYEAKDVGLIFTKWDDWHFDESVVVTGNEQTEYMKVVLASVSEYAPKLTERTVHLTHGLVKLTGNVKMSSRKGNFLKAVEVLKIVEEEVALQSENTKEVDMKIVLAAIKYAFLKYKMGGDIVFDPKESVAMTGNSGVYLIYSVVRAGKILNSLASAASDSPVRGSRACSPAPLRASNLSCISSKNLRFSGEDSSASTASDSPVRGSRACSPAPLRASNLPCISSKNLRFSGEDSLASAASDSPVRGEQNSISAASDSPVRGEQNSASAASETAARGEQNSASAASDSPVRGEQNSISAAEDTENLEKIAMEDQAVRKLSKKIVQYEDVLKEAIFEKAPNKICTYLYELAQEFSRFYEKVKVVGNERENELKKVIQAYKNVMQHGLGLMGIDVPEEM